MTLFISYPDMNLKYSIKVIELGHQPDYITPKTIQLLHENGAYLENVRSF